MKWILVSSEMAPLCKTGGLGDVVGSLANALARRGHEVTVILPNYEQIDLAGRPFQSGTPISLSRFGSRRILTPIEIDWAKHVRVVLLDEPALYRRPGLYVDPRTYRDYPDNGERFAVLCQASIEWALAQPSPIDILHAHDWCTALLPVYLKTFAKPGNSLAKTRSLLTLHNLAFQGQFGRDILPTLGISENSDLFCSLDRFGGISFLQSGILCADGIVAVSRQYAKEILTPEFGFGFDDLLRSRGDRLTGIVNGIDTDDWNPETDENLWARYGSANWESGKRANRAALRDRFGLSDDDTVPLVGVVSRLTEQKGIDVILSAAPELLERRAQFIFLGTGDHHFEREIERWGEKQPTKWASAICFDEVLARQIFAASDLFLMPSRFEPCGLSQLYALRYGSLPIVHGVGGLVDTVRDAADPSGTGFVFVPLFKDPLLASLDRARARYRDRGGWAKIVEHAMAADWSWEKSAADYEAFGRQLAPAND